ncbi:cadherin repeat domain-containing protein [Ulvibacter litoralis]|uniref:Cadherin domain-containing protein n=1 Tax=Ulvibacter litoralis TaxID=227084 RepID=A0A1G7EJS8_9FLAO|nr:cadherin repeat domain-containing protein [Ulvibacter litoralis]GHC54783.1 hypothetical protein GCM10008083_18890 [Ulvibacter litoralis]SDE63901.1 hypothetical protein SAMN05421855_10211 [Ulvibacter litoralis]
MKIFKPTLLQFSLLCVFFAVISCSKDSDNTPEASAITVTTSNFSVTINENPSEGQLIGTVAGSTNQGTVTFSITEQTPAGAFSIDTVSGELKVVDANLFEFETNPTISGTVKVANGTVSENASITITLIDLGNTYEGDLILKSQQEVIDFGANNYTKVNGSLTIGDPEQAATTDIFDLSPLQNLNTINNNFWIINNPSLVSTLGLNIDYVGGELVITVNSSLEKVEGLNNLISVYNLILSTNEQLNDLSGLSQLITVENRIILFSCAQIPNLDWLSNLTTLGSSLNVKYCNSLTNIDGLSNLSNFTQEIRFLVFTHNTLLENLNGLQNLNTQIYSLELGYNSSLTDIEGLVNFDIASTLRIHNNSALENLNGLESITSLSNGLFINDNDSLNNIQGLSSMTDVNEINIYRNNNLQNLEGLNSLQNNWKIDIIGNIQLTNFCSLQNLFNASGPNIYYAAYNAYNPTKQDIIDGNCSI